MRARCWSKPLPHIHGNEALKGQDIQIAPHYSILTILAHKKIVDRELTKSWFLESINFNLKKVACLTWEPFEMNHQYAKTWGKLFQAREDKCVSEWKKRERSI